jgi:hypothetical protein
VISIFRSSNQVIINNPHGLHGLIETIIALIQGATSFVKFGTLGVTSFIGTFGSYGYLGRKR